MNTGLKLVDTRRSGTFEVDLRLSGSCARTGSRLKLMASHSKSWSSYWSIPAIWSPASSCSVGCGQSDTFVDFDRGLNAAINRVREALGDSAENPRFVETLPRRGYRFIAPLVDSRPARATLPAAESNVSPAQTVVRAGCFACFGS